ncbi:low density lipoprotein receptor class A domain containing 4 [Nesidiocoris tenuis]|uniref:Low density lipoprotein receptor class A domain containing 4 n=1 Tax=Nesidiocoris tenuis TaxID=355587 RepID=A0ABN7BHH5_9HEMI|nr:low density lipoprotein receptor class A domain containing 4 [Nesidiocoris tenuis]
MLAVPGGGGGLGAERDRQVRLHSVTTDLALDLPPSIPLPDGEEIPYGSSTRLHIRDTDQESEIYQKCIRPPPNRTVFDGEALPPYRASPVPQDWHHLHQHRYPPVQVPPVSVPRARQRLSALTMVPCLADTRGPKPSGSPPKDVL